MTFKWPWADNLHKPVMIMLVGPTGCGKTTFRKKHLTTYACISPDDFICGGWTSDKGEMAWAYANKVAELFLSEGESFIVDAQFVSADIRKNWVNRARGFDYKVVAVCLSTTWRQILKNHKKRGDRGGYGIVPSQVIKESYSKFETDMANPPVWNIFDKKIVVKWGSSNFKKQEVMDEICSLSGT